MSCYFRTTLQLITHQSIVLESCSNLQKTGQVFESAVKKIWGFGLSVSDIKIGAAGLQSQTGQLDNCPHPKIFKMVISCWE